MARRALLHTVDYTPCSSAPPCHATRLHTLPRRVLVYSERGSPTQRTIPTERTIATDGHGPRRKIRGTGHVETVPRGRAGHTVCKRKRQGEEGLAHIDEVTRIHVEDIPSTSLSLGLDVVPKGDEVTVIGIQPRRVVRVSVPIDPPAKQELGVNSTRPGFGSARTHPL